jgi:hypothetical protein
MKEMIDMRYEIVFLYEFHNSKVVQYESEEQMRKMIEEQTAFSMSIVNEYVYDDKITVVMKHE